MNHKYIVATLLLALSWISASEGQNTTTASPSANTTAVTMAQNMTTMEMTTANAMTTTMEMTTASDMTTMEMTTANNMTTTMEMTTASDMTTTTMEMTTANNMTTMEMTTANNMTTMEMTTAPNTTTVTTTTATTATTATTGPTTAGPLAPNSTVETLTTPVSNAGCGTTRICAAEPSSCNPNGTGTCYFLSASLTSGRNFDFTLSGQSDGYVAATLSLDSVLGGNDVTYVCANNNGVVQFFGALLNNGQLTKTELNVNSVKGSVNGTTIQCTFSATVPSLSTRATAQNFTVAVSIGSFDSGSGTLGNPTTQLRSNTVDLTSPTTTVTNQLNSTTTVAPATTTVAPATTTVAPATTSHAITFQQSLVHVLLIPATLLGLAKL